MSKLNITIAGYYGYGNAGDEIILEEILKGIDSFAINSRCFILASSKYNISVSKKNKIVCRYNPFAVISCIMRSQVVLFGGGGLFQDASGSITIYYYFALLFLSILLGKKTVFFNQGIGPLKGAFSKYLCGIAFKKVSLFIVRDKGSLRLAERFTKDGKKIHLGADPVFGIDGLFKAEKKEKNRTLCVSLREWKKYPVEGVFRDLCGYFDKRGWSCFSLPFHKEKDYLEKVKNVGWEHPEEIKSRFEELSLAVGMRLHFVMIAAIKGVPAVGVSYDPKVRGFCSYMHIPCIEVSELSVEKIIKSMEDSSGYLKTREKKLNTLKNRLDESWIIFKKFINDI